MSEDISDQIILDIIKKLKKNATVLKYLKDVYDVIDTTSTSIDTTTKTTTTMTTPTTEEYYDATDINNVTEYYNVTDAIPDMNNRFLVNPLETFNLERSTQDIIAMNTYVLGMTTFSMAVVLNLASIGVILCTTLARQSSGIYLIFLLLADLLYVVLRTILKFFYSPWIDVDIFDMVGNPKALCQTWVFLTETMLYWRQWILAALIIDRCISVQCSGKNTILSKISWIFIAGSLLINAGCASYWIKIVQDEIQFDPYTPKTCSLPRSAQSDTSSAHFWMEAVAHLVYPNAVMNVVVLLAAVMLCAMAMRNKTMKWIDRDLAKGVVGLAWVNVLLTLPYILVNGCLYYLDFKYEYYSSEFFEDNIEYIAPITQELKHFIHWVTFFVLLSVRQFRMVRCCSSKNQPSPKEAKPVPQKRNAAPPPPPPQRDGESAEAVNIMI